MLLFMHYSCKFLYVIFMDFWVHSKLVEVLRSLGVVRLKVLDVGIAISKMVKWPDYRGFSGQFPTSLELLVSTNVFYVLRASF